MGLALPNLFSSISYNDRAIHYFLIFNDNLIKINYQCQIYIICLSFLYSYSDLKYHQIQSNNDLRIKLERELSQKVRQAVKTPPRERIIRRRLNEFHYEINKRLKSEEKKKQLVIQMNDKLNFNVTTNTTNTNISSLNNMNNINVMDLRMHPESYYQHLNWSKKSNINMNSQSILWNKKSGLSKKEINKLTFVPVTENNHENSYYDNQISLDSNEVHKNEVSKKAPFF